MVFIIGKQSSGKRDLYNHLIQRSLGVKKVLKLRPLRMDTNKSLVEAGSTRGYNYLSKEKMKKILKNSIEREKYLFIFKRGKKHYYALEKKEFNYRDTIVCTPNQFMIIYKYILETEQTDLDITIIYLKVDENTRLMKMLENGERINEIMKRENGDKSQFTHFEKEVLGRNERLKNNTIAIENNGYSLSNVEMETFIIKELIKMGKTFYLSDLKMLKLEKEKLRYKKYRTTKRRIKKETEDEFKFKL